MSELPTGWSTAPIEELALAAFDGPFGSALKTADYTTTGYRVARLENVGHLTFRDDLKSFVSSEKFRSLARHVLRQDDVLFSSFVDRTTRVCQVPAHLDGVMINKADCFCVRPDERAYLSRLLAYRLAAPTAYDSFSGAVRGVTRPRIGMRDLLNHEVEVPPLEEQRRIVAKLDALTARTARARADLDHVPVLAARYKQAVLARAFSGELTTEWRKSQAVRLDAKLLQASLEARRAAVSGSGSRGRRGRASGLEAGRQPVEFGALPDAWTQTDLASITDPNRLIQYGILMPGEHRDNGVPYVKVMNIRGGAVDLSRIRRTTDEIHRAYSRSALKAGDVLLTIRGTVGRVAETPAELDGGNVTQDTVRIAVLPEVNGRYVYWFLQSPMALEYYRTNQKGVAVRGINVADVRRMEFPLCSGEEQAEIVRRVDHAMVEIDRSAAEVASARRLLDRLDQANLAKAFRGELVPQDPADEPASVMLERIRVDRAQTGQRRSRRGSVRAA